MCVHVVHVLPFARTYLYMHHPMYISLQLQSMLQCVYILQFVIECVVFIYLLSAHSYLVHFSILSLRTYYC